MTIKHLEGLIKKEAKQKGAHEYDHAGYVNYELGEWLFDRRFNEPCVTYFHNVSEFEDYPEDSSEHWEWMCREDNWEMVMHRYFINYPDNFVIRCRFARPMFTQVLTWFETEWGARIKFSAHMSMIRVEHLRIPINKNEYVEESFTIKFQKPLEPIRLAARAVDTILARLHMVGYSVPGYEK